MILQIGLVYRENNINRYIFEYINLEENESDDIQHQYSIINTKKACKGLDRIFSSIVLKYLNIPEKYYSGFYMPMLDFQYEDDELVSISCIIYINSVYLRIKKIEKLLNGINNKS